jgi:uncharacterized caspase-like protein
MRIMLGMNRLVRAFVLALVAGLGCACAHAADDRCGSGRDLIVQALEHAGPTSGDGDYENALQLLKHAVSTCTELGDAWYYRGLVEQRLGHASLAQYSMDKARMFGSEAMQQGLNPFVLATPPARGTRGLGNGAAQPGAPVAGTPSVAGPVQQKWALVVGISHFEDHAIQSLDYTTQDANAFAAELKDPAIGHFSPDKVKVLTDDQATTRNIKMQLNAIARQAQPNDLVVIYVATHGSSRDLDKVGQVNYLVTYDTEILNADQPDQDALYATALPMVDLANAVATRVKALRTMVILDTCYSGGAIQHPVKMGAGMANSSPSQANLDRISEGTGRIVITAASADEESLESTELRHGYFTYFLLQALKSGHGMTPMSQVYASVAQEVSQRVAADSKKDGDNFEQHPMMSRSSDDADFALGMTAGGGTAKGGR